MSKGVGGGIEVFGCFRDINIDTFIGRCVNLSIAFVFVVEMGVFVV